MLVFLLVVFIICKSEADLCKVCFHNEMHVASICIKELERN